MNEETAAEDSLEDIPLVHRAIVRAHGRDCYNIAMCAGLATEGLSRLDEMALRHHSKQGGIAVLTVQAQLNKLLGALMVLQGITREQVQECQGEILQTPIEGSRVQLLH